MWYFVLPALSRSFCPGRDGRRTPASHGRPPRGRGLARPARPEHFSPRGWGRSAAECAPKGRQRPTRAHYPPCLQPPRRGVSAAYLLSATPHGRAGGECGSPTPPRLVTPEAWDLRPPEQSGDPGGSGRGECCPRPEAPARQPRSEPHGVAAPGGERATRHAGDYQARPGVHPPKKARARLLRWARRHPDWALGFADERWGSRVAQPPLHAWPPAPPPVRGSEQTLPSAEPAPQAWACDGLLVQARTARGGSPEPVWLPFVTRRPLRALRGEFVTWVGTKLRAAGNTALWLGWAKAAWHRSHAVRHRRRAPKQRGNQQRPGLRIVPCLLPLTSPGRNPLEAQGGQGNRAVGAPSRLLPATELAARVSAYFGCPHQDPLSIPQEVS